MGKLGAAKPVPTRTFYSHYFADFRAKILNPLKSLLYEEGSLN